uniref:response regulator transcription factor n=1 Tax=uncultured Cetobacterium sp. TaxID=527638 RepID=UPI00260C1DF9
KKKNILIIEDEAFLRDILRRYLEKENYNVFQGESGESGIEIFKENQIDLVLLDIMLPKMQGWEVCKKIKEISSTPIIILTSRSEDEDEAKGLTLGADDYIIKPFKPKALLTRIRIILEKNIINFPDIIDDLEIYRDTYKVFKDGEDIALGLKGFHLLNYLILNKNIILSRETILNNVWKDDFDVDERVVDTWIKILRQKIGDKYIKTIRGVGYEFKLKD